MNSLTLQAYAKINIGLRVVNRRKDEYHDLVTIFQRISLADEITLNSSDNGIMYSGPLLTEHKEDNLCFKAAEAFQKTFGRDYGIEINLKKNIPAGAGLGGGSSDAAAVIRGMAEIYGKGHETELLMETALIVGSDIPFFLTNQSAALGQGRGEVLTAIRGLNHEKKIIIIWPGFTISTRWAYITLDDCLTFDQNNISIIVRTFLDYNGGRPLSEMQNDFEVPVFDKYPVLRETRDALIISGAEFAGLCGSGSAIFGVFDGGTQIGLAELNLQPSWISFVCRSC